MKRTVVLSAVVAAAAALFPLIRQQAQGPRTKSVAMPEETCFRVLFGVGDAEPTPWDGSVELSGGKIVSIKGWRFTGTDTTDYKSNWQAATRRGQPQTARARERGVPGPVLENGVILGAALADPNARFDVKTKQGQFSFTAGEVDFGQSKTVLNGRVTIDRVPGTLQLTTSDEEDDYPALAQDGGDVWVAYVHFVHGDRAQAMESPLKQEPKSFDFLARPVGGDQVKLLRYSKAKKNWEPSVPVSEPGQDIMRTAVAVDGRKRVWVVWSANQKGNFDLYARYLEGGRWSAEKRLTSDAGTDINPVAATDAGGRVWIAWQAFRRGNLEVLAAVQNGDGFAAERAVSFSRASDWDPAIAAAPNGDVAVSWDTYDKGDYDVWFRRMRAGAGGVQMDAPAPVAASGNFEARSSLGFDAKSRLWVAYEASADRWGKDFGAYDTSGVALYQGHNVRVKCFDGPSAYTTADDVAKTLPGPPAAVLRRAARRPQAAPAAGSRLPNPELAAKRAPSATPQPPPLPLNSFPRIAVDGEGTVYLAVRTAGGGWRSPVGTVWWENVLYYDGQKWVGPIFVPRTDGLLDNRPALAALEPGHLLMVSAMDHRQSQVVGGGRRGSSGVNSDIYAARFRTDRPARAMKLAAVAAEKPAAPAPEVKVEVDQVAAMRNYRVTLGTEKLQVLRGEFHRHTEMSGDGGRDGPVIDAYRYMIDAAYMDWGGCCDHDNGGGREYFWWTQQKLTDAYKLGNQFVPMFSYERSVRYPEGHRNAVFVERGIRPLPRLPITKPDSAPAPAPDTQMLYRYLRRFNGIVASHTSGTDMGTDWRDNDPLLEPVVEIYQGDRQNYEMPGAPRANTEGDSIGGWRPLGFVSLALQKGYRLGFQASSDHISTHMSYCNLWVSRPTREGIMEAFRKRRVYGATDDILAEVRSGAHFMGEEFTVSQPPSISVKLVGTANFARVQIIKDNQYVYTVEPGRRDVQFTWRDNAAVKGKTSYYYVRGEQSDGELVWVSPMWIRYE